MYAIKVVNDGRVLGGPHVGQCDHVLNRVSSLSSSLMNRERDIYRSLDLQVRPSLLHRREKGRNNTLYMYGCMGGVRMMIVVSYIICNCTRLRCGAMLCDAMQYFTMPHDAVECAVRKAESESTTDPAQGSVGRSGIGLQGYPTSLQPYDDHHNHHHQTDSQSVNHLIGLLMSRRRKIRQA